MVGPYYLICSVTARIICVIQHHRNLPLHVRDDKHTSQLHRHIEREFEKRGVEEITITFSTCVWRSLTSCLILSRSSFFLSTSFNARSKARTAPTKIVKKSNIASWLRNYYLLLVSLRSADKVSWDCVIASRLSAFFSSSSCRSFCNSRK